MSGEKVLMESPSIQWTLWLLINKRYDGRQMDIYESLATVNYIYMAHVAI